MTLRDRARPRAPAGAARRPDTARAPVVAAWGGGVDSTAMIIEWLALGLPLDVVLFADTGSEKPETYGFIPVFSDWLQSRGVRLVVVRYRPTRFKNYPPYATLVENLLTNGTLPSASFGRSTCSLKWKVAPQDDWTRAWPPAVAAWARGQKVVKLIGYDAGKADTRRYAHAITLGEDPHYENRYPLREWGWDRAACERRIAAEGLPVPVKSSCYVCVAMTPAEVDALPRPLLRRIVLVEARAAPRLRTVQGLWRTSTKGARGRRPRPGRMTDYIVQQGLLPVDEVEEIVNTAPTEVLRFQDVVANMAGPRPPLRGWVTLFDRTSRPEFQDVAAPDLYGDQREAA